MCTNAPSAETIKGSCQIPVRYTAINSDSSKTPKVQLRGKSVAGLPATTEELQISNKTGRVDRAHGGECQKWSKTAFKQSHWRFTVRVKSSLLCFWSGMKLLSHVTRHFGREDPCFLLKICTSDP